MSQPGTYEYHKECQKTLADIRREREKRNAEWEKKIEETFTNSGEEAAQRIADGMMLDNLHFDQLEMLFRSNMQFAMLREINSTLMEIKNQVMGLKS